VTTEDEMQITEEKKTKKKCISTRKGGGYLSHAGMRMLKRKSNEAEKLTRDHLKREKKEPMWNERCESYCSWLAKAANERDFPRGA